MAGAPSADAAGARRRPAPTAAAVHRPGATAGAAAPARRRAAPRAAPPSRAAPAPRRAACRRAPALRSCWPSWRAIVAAGAWFASRSRSTSSGPTTTASSRSTGACRTSCRRASTSTRSTTVRRARPTAHRRAARGRVLDAQAALARRRRRPRAPARARRAGRQLMSARNRELFALIPAVAAASPRASRRSSSQRSRRQLSNVSLTYGAIFLGLCLAAHIVLRLDAAARRPVPLPARRAAGLLRPGDDLPDRRRARARAGAVVRHRARRCSPRRSSCCATTACWSATATRSPSVGIGLLLLPRVPGIGARSTAPTWRSSSARSPSSRRSSPRSRSSSSWPATCATRARCWSPGRAASLGVTIPPLKHFGPLLVVWGAAMLMLFFIRDLGSSLMFFGAFLAMLYVATDRLLVRGDRPGAVRRSARGSSAAHRATSHDRVDAWQHPFEPALYDRSGRQLPDRPVAVRAGRRRAVRAAASARRCSSLPGGGDRCCPAPHTDLIYAVIVNELGPGRRLRRCCCVYLLFVQRGFKIAHARARLVLQAAGHRADARSSRCRCSSSSAA